MLASLLITGIAILLLMAAWHDIATRLIPDAIPIGIAILAIGLRLSAGPWPLLASALTAAAVFAVLLGLAIRGWLGGGDVKLAAALALALPPELAWHFIIVTAACGGALALPYIGVARLQPAMLAASQPGRTPPQGLVGRVARAEARRLRQGGPLPYAVAIAAGGLVTLIGTVG